jgi:hypothetical protein
MTMEEILQTRNLRNKITSGIYRNFVPMTKEAMIIKDKKTEQ